MDHRALAATLLLVSSGCGLDATSPDDLSDAAIPADAAASDAGAKPPVAPATTPVPSDAMEPTRSDAPSIARLDPEDAMRLHRVLPAISADGRLIATVRYEELGESLFVDLVRARTGRRIRSLRVPLYSEDGATPDRATAAVDRLLDRRGFVTFRELEPVLPEDHWDGIVRQWTDGDLAVHYDAQTGGLAVYRGYAPIHQSLVRAQVPDGPGVGLMDPDHAALPMIPAADDVRISPDGRTLAIRLSACDCSCDIEPFWKLITL